MLPGEDGALFYTSTPPIVGPLSPSFDTLAQQTVYQILRGSGRLFGPPDGPRIEELASVMDSVLPLPSEPPPPPRSTLQTSLNDVLGLLLRPGGSARLVPWNCIGPSPDKSPYRWIQDFPVFPTMVFTPAPLESPSAGSQGSPTIKRLSDTLHPEVVALVAAGEATLSFRLLLVRYTKDGEGGGEVRTPIYEPHLLSRNRVPVSLDDKVVALPDLRFHVSLDHKDKKGFFKLGWQFELTASNAPTTRFPLGTVTVLDRSAPLSIVTGRAGTAWKDSRSGPYACIDSGCGMCDHEDHAPDETLSSWPRKQAGVKLAPHIYDPNCHGCQTQNRKHVCATHSPLPKDTGVKTGAIKKCIGKNQTSGRALLFLK